MHPVENIMRTTMEQLKEMVDVNTVIGKPILTAGETMILPVSRLSMGFISGGGEYGQEKTERTPVQKSSDEMRGVYQISLYRRRGRRHDHNPYGVFVSEQRQRKGDARGLRYHV